MMMMMMMMMMMTIVFKKDKVKLFLRHVVKCLWCRWYSLDDRFDDGDDDDDDDDDDGGVGHGGHGDDDDEDSYDWVVIFHTRNIIYNDVSLQCYSTVLDVCWWPTSSPWVDHNQSLVIKEVFEGYSHRIALLMLGRKRELTHSCLTIWLLVDNLVSTK